MSRALRCIILIILIVVLVISFVRDKKCEQYSNDWGKLIDLGENLPSPPSFETKYIITHQSPYITSITYSAPTSSYNVKFSDGTTAYAHWLGDSLNMSRGMLWIPESEEVYGWSANGSDWTSGIIIQYLHPSSFVLEENMITEDPTDEVDKSIDVSFESSMVEMLKK